MSAPVGSSEEDTAPSPISGTGKRSSDTSRQLSCETVSDCLHNVRGTSGTVNIGEPQGTIDDKVIKGCTNEVGMASVLRESTDKQDDGAAASVVKDDKENVQDNYDKSSSGNFYSSLGVHL